MTEPTHTDRAQLVNELGSFIREQRSSARLSLRRLSELAGISNPYLSQIERGLRRPSAEILQQIAKALRISAETLYVQAGILERARRGHRPVPAHLQRPPPDRGAAPGPPPDLPLVPPRERGPGRIGPGHRPEPDRPEGEPRRRPASAGTIPTPAGRRTDLGSRLSGTGR